MGSRVVRCKSFRDGKCKGSVTIVLSLGTDCKTATTSKADTDHGNECVRDVVGTIRPTYSAFTTDPYIPSVNSWPAMHVKLRTTFEWFVIEGDKRLIGCWHLYANNKLAVNGTAAH